MNYKTNFNVGASGYINYLTKITTLCIYYLFNLKN